MGVLLQGFYKVAPNNAVPSPADGDVTVPWWWDHLAVQAQSLCLAGFTAVWFPPVLKTSSGARTGADGYGPFDDYDIGSRKQKGSVATRFGTREQLQRAVAIFRANGIDVYLDMVEHQRVGDTTPFVFRYPGADGTPDTGRFPKNPSNFVPQAPRDPNLGGPASQDIPFGRELAPINGKPSRYVFNNLIAAAAWLNRALDIQGCRVDDVKGLSTDFLLPFLNSEFMAGNKFAVGEFFDGNRDLINNWIFNPNGMKGRASAFDFPLKFALNAMCNRPGGFNMAQLDHAGLVGISPLNAVTFVENHDTDLSDNNRIVINKILAYAYILTSEGYPCVYYRDYSTDKGCYGLKPGIDNLIWIHEKLAAGPTQQLRMDFNVIAYERLGGPHLLVGLNNDPGNARTIKVDTAFGGNLGLHDYTGHGPDVFTDGNGAVTITIPRNDNGLGYVCYSRQGAGGGFDIVSRPLTQNFEAARDLDIRPALDGIKVTTGKIWCATNSKIVATLKPHTTNWTAQTFIDLELLSPDGTTRASQNISLATPAGASLQATAQSTGAHTLQVTGKNFPPGVADSPYSLSVTYSAPQTFDERKPSADPTIQGQWAPPFKLANVAIHAHLLPNERVLYWGRRKQPGSTVFATLNEHECTTYIWDPATNTSKATSNQPTLADGTKVNLFCSGHTFLEDGRLMVIGGHLFDSQGVNQACVYDPATDHWTAVQLMNNGRWYPTAVTLPDGSALACAGTFATGPLQPPTNDSAVDTVPQVWNGTVWRSLEDFNLNNRPSLTPFPRMHVAPDGGVFMSGGLAQSFFLDTANTGSWAAGPSRASGLRDYAPSIMYDVGKVIFIGGGLDSGTQAPTNIVEIIDLNAAVPKWELTSPMHFSRRQHNATLLPDGSVLVTGGTQGNGFNNLDPQQPIHAAELWDPSTKEWTVLAAEQVDRCYHSIAVLLPDGRVLSAGGGEYAPSLNVPNAPKDSHADAQLFSPPYLFKGPRPSITNAPDSVRYGQSFNVQVPEPNRIESVTWIRLASVTHSFDQNQRINFLAFSKGENTLTVTAPSNANMCPPGHYMLFVLNDRRVPSVGRIIKIGAAQKPDVKPAAVVPALRVLNVSPVEKDAVIVKNAKRPPVVVGITPTCPYGIGACWGGAHEALQRLDDIEVVRPIPNAHDSTAYVYLKHDRLPDIDKWQQQFSRIANGSYLLRGIEISLVGKVELSGDRLALRPRSGDPLVNLEPLNPDHKIQWSLETRLPKPLLPEEENACKRLSDSQYGPNKNADVEVTGPLRRDSGEFTLEVRQVTFLDSEIIRFKFDVASKG